MKIGDIVQVELDVPAPDGAPGITGTVPAPAIITAVHEDGTVNLRAFADGPGGDVYRSNVDLDDQADETDAERSGNATIGDVVTASGARLLSGPPAGAQVYPPAPVSGTASGPPSPNVG